MMNHFRTNRKSGNRSAGFTLVELMVAAVLSAVLVAIIYTLYVSYSQVVVNQEERVEVQQISRMALQALKNELMLVGRNVAQEKGQESVVYAAPYEMLYNADHHYLQKPNLSGDQPDPDVYGSLPSSKCITYGTAGLDDYCGNDNWESSAETVHITMEDPPVGEDFSFSPYDREVRMRINGNTASERVAYGIRFNDGTMSYAGTINPPVLFSFWGDFDLNPATPDTLWGDSSDPSSVGSLTSAEISALLEGSYEWRYDSAVGEQVVPDIPGGAVFLNLDGNNDYTNSEDKSNFGVLDPGEDLNGNGRLDTNLLDHAIHRIEINVIGIAQYLDEKYSHPNDSLYHYREHHVKTTVDPRNLRKTPVVRTCGNGPPAPTGVAAQLVECSREIRLTWNRSADDGANENDVMWYEIQRKVPPEEGGGTGSWTYYSYVPAHGQSSYSFTDAGLDVDQEGAIVSKAYTYQVSAVDCASQQSPWAASSPVTPSQNFPVAPEKVIAHTIPCFTDASGIDSGGIAVTWKQSPTSGVDEYWIYRGDKNDTTRVYAEPFAKPRAVAPYLDTTCASSPTTERDAFYDCKDSNFFQYTSTGGGTWLVWKDVVDSPGRGDISMIPEHGHQFGILNGDDENSIARYVYEVRAFNSTAANRCLSAPAVQTSLCEDDYCDSQGYQATSGGAFDTNARSRYAPPRYLQIQDATVVNANGVMHPRFILTWNESLSEMCEFGSNDPTIPDIDRYLVYRSNQPIADPFLSSYMLDPNRACSLNFFDADFYHYSGGSLNSNGIFAFHGVDAAANPTTETVYTFVDDSNFYSGGTTPSPTHVAYQLQTNNTLQPSSMAFVPRPLQTGYECLWENDPPCNPSEVVDFVYEYLVAAANPDGASGGGDPWSFGGSCVQRGKFECIDTCIASLDLTAGNEPFLNQCSLRGGADQVDVYFKFDGAGVPSGAAYRLVAREGDDPANPWLLVDTTIDMAGGWMHGTHEYGDGDNGPGTIGQRPPVLWEYAVQLICADEVKDCTRYLSLGLHLPAGLPDLNSLCFNPNMSGCDSTNKARFDCGTGLFRFHFDDALARCNNGAGPITTQEQFMWYRITRWSKAPSYYGASGSWPWCENSWQGFPFPVEPEEYPEGRCSLPDTPAEKIYYVRADGDHCSFVPEPAPMPGPDYECLSHVSESSTAAGFFKRTGNHKYGFQEYVNPNLDYWYMVELRIDHDPLSAGGKTRPVRCCPGMSPGAAPPDGDDCPGGYQGNDTCNGVVFPYSVISYEHIQCYPAWNESAYTYGPGTVDFERFLPTGIPNTQAWEQPIEYSSPYNMPWLSWNFTITIPALPPFWSDPIELVNEHMFYYRRDGGGSAPPNDWMTANIRSDIEGVFGQMLIFIIELAGETLRLFCDVVNFFLGLFGDSWPECYDIGVDFANHSYVWSHFTPPSGATEGQCGASNSDPQTQTLDGDMLWHFSTKANHEDRHMLAAFRGTFDPTIDGFSHYWVNYQFDRSSQTQACFSLGYKYKDYTTDPPYVQKCITFPDEEHEDDWFTTLVLVCDNHVTGSPYLNHTFVYVWIRQDGDLENPSGGEEGWGWDWQRGPYVWGGDGSEGREFFYHVPPDLAFNTYPNVPAPVPSGLPAPALYTVDNPNGKIGFWVDPWDFRTPTPEYRYDNIRVTKYCGKCPPDPLWSATKLDGKHMPDGWIVGSAPFYESMQPHN